jgi:predicted flap endonuclease-1-like 5' DNA nuclease
MNLLFRIVYAAHANGTHHKLALDALRYLDNPQAEAWRRLFLSEAEAYLEASKIPDKEFKDFKNHVLHVGDDFWGGAPEKVESWYKMLVRALEDGTWSEAVWAAGIMSHYYTDPIHPFHTAQSPAENEIHRAVEWSISKSYDDLWRTAARLEAPAITIGTEPAAIKDHVIAGAEFSNRYYETLIAHYDFARGVVEPTEGLDAVSRALVSELLRYAAVGTARLIDRALAEAGGEPPKVELTAKTVIAGLKIPAKWVTRKLEDAADRRQVEAMFDELTETGRVEAALPEDDRQVRDLHEAEVVAPRRNRLAENRARRRRESPLPQGQIPWLKSAAGKNGTAAGPLASLRRRLEAVELPLPTKPEEKTTTAEAPPPAPPSTVPETGPRTYLAEQDDVERAPSIGPKTAGRLYGLAIKTVADLLAADPADIARRLGDSRIDADKVTAWQQQARLVMEIPGLRGGQAQLLVGGGLTTVDAIAETEPADAMAAILGFANTHDGRRALRDAPPPDLEKVHTWVQRARAVKAAA